MKKQLSTLIVCLIFTGTLLIGQAEDPVLFTVADKPILMSEFNYIYSKTNGKKADFSRESLEEYLDLYIKFKLKVQKALEMKLDTIPSLQQELAGYRRQLANSYLIDKEVTEELTKELYKRMSQDIELGHIMFQVKPNATNEEIEVILLKANKIKEKLEAGESFEEMAKKFSEDKSSKDNGGKIGYLTAMLPNGFYELESAAYELPIGGIAGPVKSKVGYHIVKVINKRPARGEIEVAHILCRNKEPSQGQYAEFKSKQIYKQLQQGSTFEELAKSLSEDKASGAKGGYLGTFGINRYEKSFEEAAFALENDGDYSNPVPTAAGWHIIKRISKKELEPYDEMKTRLQAKIKQDSRYNIAKESMINRIKKDNNFEENPAVLSTFIETLDDNFTTHRWRPSNKKSTEVLFKIGKDENYTVSNFETFLGKSSRDRMRMGQNTTVSEVAQSLYKNFVDETLLAFEERQLETKYPEFKSLMREYEEGILLFEATKILVWDKASQDTLGLAEFYKTQADKYKWEQRAQVSIYTLAPSAGNQLAKLQKYAAKKPPKKVLAKFNKKEKVLQQQERTFEKGKNVVLDKLKWVPGTISEVEINKRDKSINFMKIEKIIAPTEKTLKEARGYVVADYQDSLEKQWLKSLQNDYKVVVNEKVFEQLVKQ